MTGQTVHRSTSFSSPEMGTRASGRRPLRADPGLGLDGPRLRSALAKTLRAVRAGHTEVVGRVTERRPSPAGLATSIHDVRYVEMGLPALGDLGGWDPPRPPTRLRVEPRMEKSGVGKRPTQEKHIGRTDAPVLWSCPGPWPVWRCSVLAGRVTLVLAQSARRTCTSARGPRVSRHVEGLAEVVDDDDRYAEAHRQVLQLL